MNQKSTPEPSIPSDSISRPIRLGFASVIVLLLLSAGISYYNTNELYDSNSHVAKRHQILSALSDVLSTMKDVETGQRGYVITGDKVFLAPYFRATAEIQSKLKPLDELLADNSEQRARLAALTEKIDLCLEISRQSNQLRVEKGFDAAKELAATGQGKKAMDGIRALVETMSANELSALHAGERQSGRSYVITTGADLLVAFLGLALVGIAFELVRRELRAHKRTAKQLEEQRTWLHVTLTSIGDAVIVTSADGIITFLNPRAETLTGWGQDAVGRNLADVFHIIDEATGRPAENPVDAVVRQGATVSLTDRTLLLPRSAAPIAIDDSAAPIRDAKGRMKGVVLVFRDIADRMRADEAVRASEIRYRRLFETAQDAILILDGDSGRIIDSNPFVSELLGFERTELMGKELWQTGLFDDAEANQRALGQLREHGILHYEQLPLHTRTGARAEAECVGIVYEMDRKKLIQFNLHDITARVVAEEGLRAARDRFRSVVDHVIHGIISIDEAGLIESVNPAAERLFGYAASEIIGKNVNFLMPEPYHSEHDSYLANYLRTGQAKIIGIGREVLGLRRNGTIFPMELAVSTFPLGKRQLFTGIVQDITDRKQLEEELRRRVEQLREADRRKNEFLAMLAHELRNPLAPVHNAVKVLRKNCPEDEETKWAHDVIERQVQHITRMVDDLLDVSRITRGKINLQREPIEAAAAVARAVEMAQPLIDARKHQLTISVPAEPIWLEADAPRLAQVLANLLNNASKYTEDGGQIWLTVEADGGDVLLKVRDTGIGIPPDYLPRVFDLFSQEDSSFGRTQGGLGIGLTLVRSLVKMHGGAIEAFSPGIAQGSEFVVRLPRLRQAPTPAATSAGGEPATVVPPRRILVVDDNIDGARSLSILLRHAGHDVQTANDGPTALDLARTWLPQVVLLDIGMPQMNGLEVARLMRRDLGMSKTLLVAMTGYGQDEDRQRSQEAGFNAHMVKPLDLDDLRLLLARPEGDGAP